MSDDFHPIADLFPLLDGAAFDQLVADIKANGVREPIVRHRDGRIVDGRNRWRAGRSAGVECPSRVFPGDDAELLAFVISANVQRRHLRTSQRAMIAAKLATVPQGGDRRSASFKPQICGLKIEEAATRLGVSERTVESAKAVLRDGIPEMIEAVEDGRIAVSTAAMVVKNGPASQTRALEEVHEIDPEAPPPGFSARKLEEIQANIDRCARAIDEADRDWVEATLNLCADLAKARAAFPSNHEFGQWCDDTGINLDKDDRDAAIAMGKDLDRLRRVLEALIARERRRRAVFNPP